MKKYFRILKNQFNNSVFYSVNLEEKNDLFTIVNRNTGNILYQEINETEKSRLLTGWYEY